VLIGGGGSDTIVGGSRSDILRGGGGADHFVFDSKSLDGADVIKDFRSGVDIFAVTQDLQIGDGDATIENAVSLGSKTGWSAANELVIFTADQAGLTASDVAAWIGPASGPISAGYRQLFVFDDATDVAVFLFTSADGDASVSAAELTQLAMLQGAPSVVITDFDIV
jgi:serralysin